MMKKTLCFAVSAILLLVMSGCMLSRDYFTLSDYVDNSGEDEQLSVANYNQLRQAVVKMVENHDEKGEVVFNSYDGDIATDMATACREVKADTAIGVYCVDYMSYDLSQIMTYYKAEIFISYNRTAEETQNVISVNSSTSMTRYIGEAMQGSEASVAFIAYSALIDVADIPKIVERLYYSNPLYCIRMPEIKINLYPEDGLQQVIEITFDYGIEADRIDSMKTELLYEISSIANEITEEADEKIALRALQLLSELCVYDPTSLTRIDELGEDNGQGSTAYGALVEGCANSEGFAMAYSALCQSMGIYSEVIVGRFNTSEHAWSAIELYKAYYHVDPSQNLLRGTSAVFMRNDADFSSSYWWDTEKYPACNGTLKYYG